jgi:hypothetical protein
MDDTREVKLVDLQEIVNYLQGKPYHEVYQLINIILIASQDKKE